jgi:hypothetical protein
VALMINFIQSIEQLFLFSQPANFMSEYTSAKNSLHLLARLLPFVFEHNEDRFVDLLFFDNLVPQRIPAHLLNELKQIDAQHNHDVQPTQHVAPSQQETEALIIEGEVEPQTPNTLITDIKPEQPVQEAPPVRSVAPEQPTVEQQQPVQEAQEVKAEQQPVQESQPAPQPEQPAPVEQPVKEETKIEPVAEQQSAPSPREPQQGGKKRKGGKKNKKNQQSAPEPVKQEPVKETPQQVKEEVNVEQPPQEVKTEDQPTQETQPAPQPELPALESEIPALEPVDEEPVQEVKVEQQQPVQETQSAPQPEQPAPQPVKEESKPQQATGAPSQVTYDIYKQGLRQITHLADEKLQTSLARAMIATFMRVLFIPGFSVPLGQITPPNKEIVTNDLDKSFLWDKGLGDVNNKYAPSYEQLDNRHDTLKCLIAAFSGVLYLPSDDCNRIENKFLTIATSSSMPNTKTLLFSLLNMVLNYDPRGYMPYTTQVFTNYAEKYLEMALHMSCILVHHRPAQGTNVYVDHVRSITEEEFKLIYKGITLNLNNVVQSNNTYLPNSQRQISFYEELLVLLWKFISENSAFRIHVCRDEDISQLLIPLLFIIQTHSTDQSKFPVVQMAAFTLLLLSGHREFGVALNKIFAQKVPLELPIFSGNYADLLIILFHKVMVADKGVIRPLYDCLLTIIANISPYTKSLSLVASVKLLNLFEAFSSPRFLYSSEKNHQFVYLLLEVFNNLIQYQYEGNTHLVYAILRRKKVFRELEKDHNLDEIREGILKRSKQKRPEEPVETFLPSDQWVKTWKSYMPLTTVKALLTILTPEVEKLCAKELATEDDVLDYLRRTTLVGLLPVPHTIIIRTFQNNPRIDIFLTTYLWGLVYLKSLVPPSFDANTIKLFQVNVLD